MRSKQTDEFSYKSELKNFLIECVKEAKKFTTRGPIEKNDRKVQNATVYKLLKSKEEVKKRNIRTAVPGKRSRTIHRPNHILNNKRQVEKSFDTVKVDNAERHLDPFAQKLVSNDDLFAEIIYKIALLPVSEKDVNTSLRDTTGLDLSTEDQILNLKRDHGDLTKVNTTNDNINISGDASMEWINNSMVQPKNRNQCIIRRESEDSFIRM